MEATYDVVDLQVQSVLLRCCVWSIINMVYRKMKFSKFITGICALGALCLALNSCQDKPKSIVPPNLAESSFLAFGGSFWPPDLVPHPPHPQEPKPDRYPPDTS